MTFKVLRAHAIYSLKPTVFADVPVFDLVDAVNQRYNFRQIPPNNELLTPPPNQPTNFVWGKAKIGDRSITIDLLQVQNFPALAMTVGVVTKTSTDDSDLVLDDLAKLMTERFGIETTPILPTSYQSQLEVAFHSAVNEHFRFSGPIGKAITEYVKSYGFPACPTYIPTMFGMYFDTSKPTTPPTFSTSFTIERRVGVSFEENKYYSQAPLRTKDHEALLSLWESLL